MQDIIPALDLKKCLCGKKISWTKKDGITRSGYKCDKCSKQLESKKKERVSSGYKRKRCLSCNNFTVSKLSTFCFKCDPRKSLVSIKKTDCSKNNAKRKISDIIKFPQLVNKIKILEKNDIFHNVDNNEKLTKQKINKKTQRVIKNSYAKLENPGLNICFLNAAVQFILSIKSLSDLI